MTLINLVLTEPNDMPYDLTWASDINYSNELNILDIIKLVYFVLFH